MQMTKGLKRAWVKDLVSSHTYIHVKNVIDILILVNWLYINFSQDPSSTNLLQHPSLHSTLFFRQSFYFRTKFLFSFSFFTIKNTHVLYILPYPKSTFYSPFHQQKCISMLHTFYWNMSYFLYTVILFHPYSFLVVL